MDDNFKNALIKEYLENGERAFYKKLLSNSVKKIALLIKDKSGNSFPDMELLAISEMFLNYYRMEGEEVYLNISKVCRKAAHKLYRVLLKQHLVKKNKIFLNLV
jgi:hypothetical protein